MTWTVCHSPSFTRFFRSFSIRNAFVGPPSENSALRIRSWMEISIKSELRSPENSMTPS
ncbi:unnamed protein product [Haemonchus placei]|uniref:Uncharacterized protein n=1 Tax=Haemonchus placei TaxID=6290 RepID=A0A0N4VZH4_HAEPC|nr:unnamed protein product [Haemonchus placei]